MTRKKLSFNALWEPQEIHQRHPMCKPAGFGIATSYTKLKLSDCITIMIY